MGLSATFPEVMDFRELAYMGKIIVKVISCEPLIDGNDTVVRKKKPAIVG